MSLFPPLFVVGVVTFVLLTETEEGLEDVVVVEGDTFVVFAEVEMVEVVLLLKEDVDVVMVVAFEDVESSEDEGVEDDKADKVEDADTAVLVAVVVDNDDDEGMPDDEVTVEGTAAIVEDNDEGGDEGAETVVVVVVDVAVAVECAGVVVEALLSNSIPPSSSSSFNRSRKISCD